MAWRGGGLLPYTIPHRKAIMKSKTSVVLPLWWYFYKSIPNALTASFLRVPAGLVFDSCCALALHKHKRERIAPKMGPPTSLLKHECDDDFRSELDWIPPGVRADGHQFVAPWNGYYP
eukprot:m.22944 g.22944  ORF g.22944 m.22944 type:complete len:118 (-) comp12846_c0_seq3:229-582(-)